MLNRKRIRDSARLSSPEIGLAEAGSSVTPHLRLSPVGPNVFAAMPLATRLFTAPVAGLASRGRGLEILASTSGNEGDLATISETEESIEVATPKMYRVLLMNDDYTPMDFVIHVLQKFFMKPTEEATRIMLEVHTKGAGQCGTYTHEIAETKVHLVNSYAQQHRFPLKCIMEKAD